MADDLISKSSLSSLDFPQCKMSDRNFITDAFASLCSRDIALKANCIIELTKGATT